MYLNFIKKKKKHWNEDGNENGKKISTDSS